MLLPWLCTLVGWVLACELNVLDVGRDISNTRMIIEGVRKGRTSVEEEVQRIIHPELRCDTSKFISAGAEVWGELNFFKEATVFLLINHTY